MGGGGISRCIAEENDFRLALDSAAAADDGGGGGGGCGCHKASP